MFCERYVTRKSFRSLCSRNFLLVSVARSHLCKIKTLRLLFRRDAHLAFAKKISSSSATPEDERLTRGTTSIQYAENAYPHSGTCSYPIAITDASGDAYLAGAVQHAALGRNSEVLRCRLSPCPARCEGRMVRTGSRSLHLSKLYYSDFRLSSIFFFVRVVSAGGARPEGAGAGCREAEHVLHSHGQGVHHHRNRRQM